MNAKQGCRVTVRFTVHDEAKNLVDPGERPVEFTIGNGEVIAGIERAVVGRQAGESFDFICKPKDAYGPYRPEMVFEAVRENLPLGLELFPGMMLEPGGGNGRFTLTVIELTENGARLDGNHPLAGKSLHFSLEVLDVVGACP